jgi:hypothetical protein
MAIPFISAQDLSDHLGRDVSADPRTVIALDAACDVVRGYIRQTINLVRDDEVWLDGNGLRQLLLPELPIVEVTDVVTYDRYGVLLRDDLIQGTDYIVDGAGVLTYLGWRWPAGRQNVWVLYTHGWDLVEEAPVYGYEDATPTVPSRIRIVALQLAARIFSAGSQGAGAIRSETIGKYSYTLADAGNTSPIALLEREERILDEYRLRRVA